MSAQTKKSPPRNGGAKKDDKGQAKKAKGKEGRW